MNDITPAPGPEPERWMPVAGYPQYLVSNQGRFCKILKPWLDENGYSVVTLNNGSKSGKKRYLHSVVAEAFIGKRPPGHEVLHGPNGKTDNRASELHYGTRQENIDDMERDGTRLKGDAHQNAKLSVAIVAECRNRYAAGEFLSVLAAEFGVSHGTMQCALDGRTWQTCPVPPAMGPHKSGESHRDAKLNEAIIRECHARNRAGEALQTLAQEFGVTRPTLYFALIGRTWKHLDLDRSQLPLAAPGPPKTVNGRCKADKIA